MRHIFTSLAAVFALVMANGLALRAQTAQDPTQAPYRQMHRRGPNAEFETKMLTKRLHLSSEQAAQVEPILADRQERMKALMPARGSQQGTQPDFKAMREQRKAIMEDTQARLDAVLTPEQKQQMTEMHQHQFHGGQRGNWAPKQGTTPSA